MNERISTTRNAHGVGVKACCASCKMRKLPAEGGRVCKLSGKHVEAKSRCDKWEMSPLLRNAGMSGGRVKNWQYLCFYRRRYLQQRDELMARRISAENVKTTADIRREYEQRNGSIYLDF